MVPTVGQNGMNPHPFLPSLSLFLTNRHTVSTSLHSWEDSSALGRAPVLGPRRPVRDPVHLA
jgi:hypothetical protein